MMQIIDFLFSWRGMAVMLCMVCMLVVLLAMLLVLYDRSNRD